MIEMALVDRFPGKTDAYSNITINVIKNEPIQHPVLILRSDPK
jgi:hypothetical protein